MPINNKIIFSLYQYFILLVYINYNGNTSECLSISKTHIIINLNITSEQLLVCFFNSTNKYHT